MTIPRVLLYQEHMVIEAIKNITKIGFYKTGDKLSQYNKTVSLQLIRYAWQHETCSLIC